MKRDYNKTLEITALYEISKLLGSSLNLKSNLRGVMRVLSEYLDMKRGTVALRSNSEVSMVAAHGMTEEEIKKGRYRLGEGIIGKVAKLGSPIVIPNVGDEPLFLNKTGARKMIRKENIAFLCVPIKFKDEVLGVLSVDRLFGSKVISFEEDLRLLKIIASLIAQTVKLHMEIEKEREAFLEEKENLRQQLKGKYRLENIIGQSDRMQEVFGAVHSVATSKANVLLRGESGTGKELIAKAIHYMSPRAKMPFIKFSCASIPEGLLESELFGHEKGAFTGAMAMRKGRFELADRGTIFLDEIGDLPLALQPKILRVLQEKEFERVGGEKTTKVDVRLIAATSRNLEALVSEGKFREDLYYRLNVVPVFLPSLREKIEDLPLLVEYFLKKYNEENHKSVSITSDTLNVLVSYDWPGNVRELENTIERLVVMSRQKVITPSDLPFNIRDYTLRAKYASQIKDALPSTIEDIEKTKILDAIKRTGGIQAKAARLLGITPRQIGYKIKKYNIQS
ncbi:MAG: nif-specific transcriptional activator NifA [Nitrospirae bacterium CG_4_10_14_3_um_filter_44_29]|nr:MAG: nif-specific transcriptional activator NifA [Nitrospirae bacterium CG22_combo_CG10-13_8_21_14_all_44_11]PIW90311.1 MAG: nif-specific transcriptional activator NifA [Nitrospirae bacterium CG_4_8_14_3_um_filter_44_28]PIX87733.1 MAG: nif-specific transcriptional activator NifA [Nitrospirae bacterium CG_4_10_14_3_um_filter_44_29]PJA82394.1 MAG: nif-specific transcriptional activator NifA [Nitrospirae bacterium CG_4_9_14_3_um_filter_44_28]